MRSTRPVVVGAIAALTAMAMSSCAQSDPGAGGSNTGGTGGESALTVTEVNALSSLNPSTSGGNSEINSKIFAATHTTLQYVTPKFEIKANEKVGKVEKTSDKPLTVKYTINKDVKWSDGTPVTAHDLMFAWAASSGWFDDKVDPADEKSKGTKYFSPANDTTALRKTKRPTIGDDGQSMTLVYETPYADWQLALDIPAMAAHIAAKKGGLSDAKALTELLTKLPKGDPKKPSSSPDETLKKVSAFWNTGYDTKTMPTDKDLLVANGPFKISQIQPEQSLTLVKNPDYTWGDAPKVDQITVRYIGDASQMISALKNGEADIIAPQASADTLQQLEGLNDVKVLKDKMASYDHLDLNYFGVFKDPAVRQAFMKVVPREDIVGKIIKKLDPEAKPLDSQIFVSSQEPYAKTIAGNTSSDYAKVDIDGAKKLLAGKTPTVRIMYNKENPNRLDTFSLIRDSATKAGFKIVDGGLPKSDWSKALGNGTYDASIFGWIKEGPGVSGTAQFFKTGASSNFNKFSDAEADKLIEQLLATTDEAKQAELQVKIDAIVWKSFYGLPLFQSPGVVGLSKKVEGIDVLNPLGMGVWWNVHEWKIAS